MAVDAVHFHPVHRFLPGSGECGFFRSADAPGTGFELMVPSGITSDPLVAGHTARRRCYSSLSVGTAPSFIESSKHALVLAVRLLRLDHSRAHRHAGAF